MTKKRETVEEYASDSVVLKESTKGQRSFEVKVYFETWPDGKDKLKNILADVQKWKKGEIFEDEVISREKHDAAQKKAVKEDKYRRAVKGDD